MKADTQKHTHLQATQANTQTKACKRVCFSPAQEKLKNKNFPSLQKNKTSQPHSTNLTQTSIEWRTALKKNYRNLTRHHFGQTEAHAGNSTLPKVAVSCFVGQFCGYINFSASMKVCAENRHLRQAAKRYQQP